MRRIYLKIIWTPEASVYARITNLLLKMIPLFRRWLAILAFPLTYFFYFHQKHRSALSTKSIGARVWFTVIIYHKEDEESSRVVNVILIAYGTENTIQLLYLQYDQRCLILFFIVSFIYWIILGSLRTECNHKIICWSMLLPWREKFLSSCGRF